MAPNAAFDIDTRNAERVPATERWINARDLIDRCMGNLNLGNRVLARLRSGLDEAVQQLEQMVKAADWGQACIRSHRLRGEAGNVGCRHLAELASQLEGACVRGDGESARSSLKALAKACGEFQQAAPSLPDVHAESAKKTNAILHATFRSRE